MKITLKKLLQKFRELGFDGIIIPSIRKGYGITKIIDDKDMLCKLEKTHEPFYICYNEKCLKIKNRKRRFVLPNGTIPKNCNYCINTKNLFRLLFNEEYINYYTLLKSLQREKKKFIFDVDLFSKNIEKDLNVSFSYEYTPEINNRIMEITFHNVLSKKRFDEIQKYFKEYKNILAKKGFGLNIILNASVTI